MCAKRFCRRLLFGVHLLLIYICIRRSQGAPVALANQPRTGAEDEGALLSQAQNKVGSDDRLLHSDHLAQHHTSDPRAYMEGASNAPDKTGAKSLLRDEQELPAAAGQVIKNFSPISSDERLGVSMSAPDRRNGRNQQNIDPHSRHMSSSETRATEISGDGVKEVQNEAREQPTDLQERINSKLKVLSKNADKSKRLSFFSVLHPALAAALSSDKHQGIADIPRPPLDNIEYSSGPLRGTESHDHDALQYPAAEQSKQSVLAEIQETAAESRNSKSGEREGFLLDAKETMNQKENRGEFAGHVDTNLSYPGREESHRSVQQHQLEEAATAGERYARSAEKESHGAEDEMKAGATPVDREARQESDQPESSESRVEPESSETQGEAHHVSFEKQASVPNATEPEEPGMSENVIRTTAKYWHGFVNRVKRVVEALRSPTSTNQDSKDVQKDKFTEDDVQDMVNGVVREIQMRKERNGRSTSGGDSEAKEVGGEREKKEEGKGPLLMLRTKTVVSSDVVADAVTTAAKKMLTERGDALSHDTSSKLLREVQDKLEELLQPVE